MRVCRYRNSTSATAHGWFYQCNLSYRLSGWYARTARCVPMSESFCPCYAAQSGARCVPSRGCCGPSLHDRYVMRRLNGYRYSRCVAPQALRVQSPLRL